MTDFVQTYTQTQGAVVCITSDIGLGTAQSTGFITRVNNTNYIVTAAHAVMTDRAAWGMDAVLLWDDGSVKCSSYKNSGSIPLPAGVRKVVFRFIASDATKGVSIDNVSVKDSKHTLFSDTFGGSNSFKPEWEQGLGKPWTVSKFKGKLFSNGARSGDSISTLALNVTTTEASTLKFDYKLDCGSDSFTVGYCMDGCDTRVSGNIQAYIGSEIHSLRVVGLDGRGDVAICVRADGGSLASFPFLSLIADSRTIPIATPVSTIGNPLGLDPQSIAVGVIRDNKYTLPQPHNIESVLTCISDYAGNSGSPYILLNGKVVGMLTWAVDSTLNGGPSAHILNRVLGRLTPQIKEAGYVDYEKVYLGLELYGVDLNIVDQVSLPMKGSNPTTPPGGFIVTNVEDDSPLLGTVKAFDVLLSIAKTGTPASKIMLGTFPGNSGPSELTWFMEPGDKVDFEVLRFDRIQNAWVQTTLPGVTTGSFPLLKDVPLGDTMSSTTAPYVKIDKTVAGGVTKRQFYQLNRWI
jgi:hypothetical protein